MDLEWRMPCLPRDQKMVNVERKVNTEIMNPSSELEEME